MSKQPIWLRPGVVIAAGCLISLIGFGVRAGFGLFQSPMMADLGWGREAFALAIAIQNLLWGAGLPFVGMIADKFGTARVLIVGAVLYAGGVYLMSISSTPLMLSLTGGVLVGLALSGTSFSLVLAAFARMVPPEKQSWAMGIGTAAGSLGQFLMVPLGQAFIDGYGWSTALLLLGLCALVIVPLSLPMTAAGKAGSGGVGEQTIAQALRQAGGHSSYLYLTAGFFVCGFHVAFVAVHLPAYITDQGLSGDLGAWALALVGLMNIVGSYASGVLGGRYPKKYLLSSIYFLRAVTFAVFIMLPVSEASVLIFSGVLGLLWLSTVPATSGLVALMFGPRYMATLFGIVFFSHQLGSFLGVWLGGYAYDTMGSYDIVWWLSVGLGLASALLHLPIVERPAAAQAALAR